MLRNAAKRVAFAGMELASLGRGVATSVDGVPLRFPARWSRFYRGMCDAEKTAFIARSCRPGDTVVDGGAHVGFYTVLMARSVAPGGQVISFEPAPAVRAILRRTVAINRCSAVEMRPEALSGADGEAVLHLAGRTDSNASSLSDGLPGASAVQVTTTTIDRVLEGRPAALLKLDIEGAELDALRGAQETIERHHPALAIEIHPSLLIDGAAAQIWELLSDHGYEVWDGARRVGSEWFCEDREPFEVQALASQAAQA